MGAPKLSDDQVAQVLAEAAMGTDAQACKQHGICRRTLANYRKRLGSDQALARLFSEKKNLLEKNWGDDAVKALGQMIRKLNQLVQGAGKDQIREVAGAIKIVGELEVVRGMVNGGKHAGASAEIPAPGAPPRPGTASPNLRGDDATSVH